MAWSCSMRLLSSCYEISYVYEETAFTHLNTTEQTYSQVTPTAF